MLVDLLLKLDVKQQKQNTVTYTWKDKQNSVGYTVHGITEAKVAEYYTCSY